MTYTEQDLIEEMEYVTKHEFMVMRHVAKSGPKYRTHIMNDLIREYPDEMDHGPGLFGKEYSDDIYGAIRNLIDEGVLGEVDDSDSREYSKLELTQYGRDLYDTIMAHPEVEIDEDLAEFIERIEGESE